MTAASRRVSLGDLATRIPTGLAVGGILLAAAIWGGVWGWATLVSGIVVGCSAEFYSVARRGQRHPNEVFGLLGAGVMPFAAAWLGGTGLVAAIVGLLFAALVWHVVFREITIADTALTVFGAIYVAATLGHLVLLEAMGGWRLVTAVLVAVWANDVFAYFFGSLMGRHKLAPLLSPNKSWEGLVAGTIGSVGSWVGAFYLAGLGLPLGVCLTLGAITSVAVVVGDLAESRIKREARIKDSGTILPGHGGFLDRFDSLIVVAPTAFWALMILGATL